MEALEVTNAVVAFVGEYQTALVSAVGLALSMGIAHFLVSSVVAVLRKPPV